MKRILSHLVRCITLILFMCGSASHAAVLKLAVLHNTNEKSIVSHNRYLRNLSASPITEKMALLKSTDNIPPQDIDSVSLTLPDGGHVTFQRWSEKKDEDGSLTWTGEIAAPITNRLSNGNPDPENTAILIIKQGKIYGSLTFKGETFQILPLAQEKNSLVIIKVDANKVAEKEKHDEVFSAPETRVNCPAPGNYEDPAPSQQVVIRVGLVTTNQSRAAFSSLDFDALAKLAFEKVNQGALNSNVRITFVNAGVLNPDYNEKSTQSQMLRDMNGELRNAILAFRQQHEADLVVLLAVRRDLNGIAWVNATRESAHAVVNYLAFTETNTFAHEMGHNIGLQHDRAQNGGNPYGSPCYQHGYRRLGTGMDRWRTIMAYNCSPNCSQVNMFSNPRVLFRNTPTGTAQYEDNARRLNERRGMISRFYSNVTPKAVVPGNFSILSRSNTTLIRELDGRSSDGYGHVWKVLSDGPMGLQEVPSGPVVREIHNVANVRAAFPANSSGQAVYELTVHGSNGRVDKKIVTVTVTAPRAQIQGAASVKQGDTVTLNGQVNFTATRWQWRLINGSQTIAQSTSRQFTLNTRGYAPGKYAVELEATSADGMHTGRSTHVLEITSTTPVVKPVAVVPDDFSLISRSTTAAIHQLDGSRSTGKSFVWRVTSDGPSGLQEVASGPIVREVQGAVARAAFPRNTSGIVTYELTATGSDGSVDKKTVTVTVTAPHAQIQGPASVKHGDSVTLTGQDNFTATHWQWSLKQGEKTVAQSNAREFVLATNDHAAGHYQVVLEATSADGLRAATSTHALEIVAPEPAVVPVVVVPEDFSLVSRSTTATIHILDGSRSTGKSFVWRVTSDGPSGLQEVASGPIVREVQGAVARAAFPRNTSGIVTYELTATGSDGSVDKKTVTVTVTAPHAQIQGPASVKHGDSVTLTGQDNFTATHWQWSLKQGEETVAQSNAREFVLATNNHAAGHYQVVLEATSADGLRTATSTHALEIVAPEPAVVPVAVVPEDFSLVSRSTTATIHQLDGSSSTGKGFIWRVTSDGPSGLQEVASGPIVREVHQQKIVRAAFPRNASGKVTYELLATGTGGVVDRKTVTVTVSAPHAQIQGAASVKQGESITLTSQSNFTASHWQWSLKQNGKTLAQSTAREFTIAAQNYAGGHYQVDLEAASADGMRSAISTHALEIISVTPPPAPPAPPVYPAYVEGTAYKAGERVSAAGGIYACKSAPYTGWCAGAAWAYAPGTGLHWQQAWDKVE